MGVTNNKNLLYVVDNIIFGISIPEYPCLTLVITFQRKLLISLLFVVNNNNNRMWMTLKFQNHHMITVVITLQRKLFIYSLYGRRQQ